MKQLERLDEITQNLKENDHVIALIATGSIGVELKRMDQYSDLDFFVIVKDGSQKLFLENTQWLHVASSKLLFLFQNTKDSFKFMYEDGIYGEQAIFEYAQLPTIIGSNSRVVFQKEGYDIDANFGERAKLSQNLSSFDFLMNEALTNIYVGYTRYLRHEKIAGYQLLQAAAEKIISLISMIEKPKTSYSDIFNPARRVEQNFPGFFPQCHRMFGSINDVSPSIEAMLLFLQQHGQPNKHMVMIIEQLLSDNKKATD